VDGGHNAGGNNSDAIAAGLNLNGYGSK